MRMLRIILSRINKMWLLMAAAIVYAGYIGIKYWSGIGV